jgi:ribosome-interacting GTPase 1
MKITMTRADIEHAIVEHLRSEGITVNLSKTKVSLMRKQNEGIIAVINLNSESADADLDEEIDEEDDSADGEGQQLDLFNKNEE